MHFSTTLPGLESTGLCQRGTRPEDRTHGCEGQGSPAPASVSGRAYTWGGESGTAPARVARRLGELRHVLASGKDAVGSQGLLDDWRWKERERRSAAGEPGLVKRLKKRQEPETLITISVFPRETTVQRKRSLTLPQKGGGTRNKIRDFSPRAARNLKFKARNVEGLVTMVTLTYPGEFPTDGRKVKRDWAAARRWLVHRKLGGLWWLEFQERGAPHLHVYLTGVVNKDDLARAWYRIVGSGDERHLKAGTRIEAIRSTHAVAAYATKYATKMEQKDVPASYQEVGRFWGLFGGVKVVPIKQLQGWSDRIEEETGEVDGSGDVVHEVVRIVRKAYQVRRRNRGLRPPRRDNGRWSFIAWDVGPAIKAYLEHPSVGLGP